MLVHLERLAKLRTGSCHRPVVASKLDSITEVMIDGVNAVLVEPDDPFSLAKGIIRVLNDKQLARRIADRAYVDVKQHLIGGRVRRMLQDIT